MATRKAPKPVRTKKATPPAARPSATRASGGRNRPPVTIRAAPKAVRAKAPATRGGPNRPGGRKVNARGNRPATIRANNAPVSNG